MSFKISKKITCMAMAIAMATTVFVTNAAAATVSASTIDTSKTASMTIYKYDMTSAQEDGVYPTNGTQLWESTGYANAEVQAAMADYAVQGVEFTYLKVADISTYSVVQSAGNSKIEVVYGIDYHTSADLLSALVLNSSEAEYTSGSVYYYQSDVLIDHLSDALSSDEVTTKNALEDFIVAKGGTTMTETNQIGKTSASGLPLGLYLVVETAVPENITCTVNPFLVSLPMTQNDGDEWNYNVTVYPKNETGDPTLDKTVTEVTTAKAVDYATTATASDGDIVAFHVESTLPTITSKATYLTQYTFVDTLSKGIEYNKNDVVIEFFSDASCTNLYTTWTETSDPSKFSVTYGTVSDGSTTMTISMTAAGLAQINPALGDYTMRISYAATVNSSADTVYGDSGNANDVTLTWRRTNIAYSDTLEDECIVYTYGLDLLKQFSDGNGDYSAVTFKIQNSTDGYYVIATKVADGIYYVNGEDCKTANEASATAFVPSSTGKLLVYGLEDDTYIINELTTDDGYTLLKDSITLNLISTVETDTNGNEYRVGSATVDGNVVTMETVDGSANALAPLTVVNTAGFDLPRTGGNGTLILTVFGMTAAACGLYVIFVLKRKNA